MLTADTSLTAVQASLLQCISLTYVASRNLNPAPIQLEDCHSPSILHQAMLDGVLHQFSQSGNFERIHEMRTMTAHGLAAQAQGLGDFLDTLSLG